VLLRVQHTAPWGSASCNNSALPLPTKELQTCFPHALARAAPRLKKKEKERKQAGAKATAVSATSKAKSQADAQAFVCAVCRTGFPVNVRSDALVQHAANKHPKLAVEQAWPQLAELQAKEAAKT
jgi:hypothetical protein